MTRAASDRSRRIATNGIELNVVEAGAGPPVILLHGFPECAYGWRHQIGPLAEAGYHVLAPDQRGYGTSDKPPRIDDYNLDRLAADVVGLIDAVGVPEAAVVGHDWGGIVAWWVAIRHPDRVARLAVLNAPHPLVFRRYLRRSLRQLLKSWYTFFFQIPWLPEALFRRRNWRSLAESLQGSSRPGTFTDAEIDIYRRAWSQPGAIRCMIHWYRAAMRRAPAVPADSRVRRPTLLIWGRRDAFLNAEDLGPLSLASCDDGRLEFLEDATHWVQHEEPAQVNAWLIAFLRGAGSNE